jgi:BRCA1-associated protein
LISYRSSKELSPGEQDRLHFVSGNPFVEVTKGIIHLFKDTAGAKDSGGGGSETTFPDTELMCMFGVPAQHKTPDLLQFTAPCHADLEYLRVLHDGSPNLYMVLLKFRSAAAAREFHAAYNGLPYNTMEPEVCCVLPVAWVEHCKVPVLVFIYTVR